MDRLVSMFIYSKGPSFYVAQALIGAFERDMAIASYAMSFECEVLAAKISGVLTSNPMITDLVFDGVKLGPSGVAKIVDALMAKPESSITSISFRGCDIGSDGVAKIAQLIRVNKLITFLDISDNNLHGNGWLEPLAGALKYNFTLQHLSLSDNDLRDATSSDTNTQSLLDIINDGSLARLDAYNVHLANAVVAKIALAIAANKSSLKNLYLIGNDDIGVDLLAMWSENLFLNTRITHMALPHVSSENKDLVRELKLSIDAALRRNYLSVFSCSGRKTEELPVREGALTTTPSVLLSRPPVSSEVDAALLIDRKVSDTLSMYK